MRNGIRILGTALLLASVAAGGRAAADADRRSPLPTTYKEECGSCHVAFPPQFLPASSWRALVAGLERHFGSDASLDADKTKAIGDYLAANAGAPERAGTPTAGGPKLRITATGWFRREHRNGHDGLAAETWRSPAVARPSNCSACHRGAADGDYGEAGLRMPN